jgi:LmbE family N-acetylglucosaminyl deacetylase
VEKNALLLIANYGSELVATAGALATNVAAGGRTHALILLARPQARPDLEKAAAVIGCGIEFADLPYGDVNLSYEQKRRLVKTIREFQPNVAIMQDPEHVWHDLDPDRRMGMMLTLEALALAGRDFAEADLPGLKPCPVPTIYYLWPEHANCVLDISPVWDIKVGAGEAIGYQHQFTAQTLEQMFTMESLEAAVPGYGKLASKLERGLALHQARERAGAIYHGLGGHGRFAMAEAYRRDGQFPLTRLLP